MTNAPVPKLDQRFSEPGARPTPWAQTQAALEQAAIFWITTVRVDGRPHMTPLVAVWLDGELHFSTGPGEQKALNLSANPEVILSTGCNDWERGLDVVVEGTAVRTTDHAQLARLATAWRSKWAGQWQFDVADGAFQHPGGGEAWVFSVAPRKILAFGKGGFSQTRYSFPSSTRSSSRTSST
jgi:general stress protein 26